MTVFSLVRRRGRLWLPLVFWFARNRPGGGENLRELSFIHFLRFAMIHRFPDHGQPKDRMRQPLLMFESNYNGTFAQYIDTFSEAVPQNMKHLWGTSYGFPGPLPVTPFKKYIQAHEFTANHYYSAYPDASTTMVVAALELREPKRKFDKRARKLTPAQFLDEYHRLLTTMQGKL
jgi:hypothetical protein